MQFNFLNTFTTIAIRFTINELLLTRKKMSIKGTAKGIYRTIRNYIFPVRQSDGKASGSIYEYKFIDDTGATIDLSMYKGKKLLIVNTASACGFTGQYSEMQQLSEKFKDKVNVIAFPCNDFGKQEKGTNEDIQSFCSVNYGVTFKVFRKTNIKRTTTTDLFYWLSNSKLNGWNEQVPLWNFWKFLIDENGKLIAIFPSRVNPIGTKMRSLINNE